jgi:hypothetical protein
MPVVVLAACRFGGPTGNPYAYVAGEGGDDASLEDESMSEGDGTSVVPVQADAPAETGGDASLGNHTPPDDADTVTRSDGASEGGPCAGTFAVCDPVHNTGCNPLQQCDVDTTQTSTPTGLCLFNSSSDAGGSACTMTLVSESCAPGHTCVSGACRALCVCDTDCPTGQCCSDTSGPEGFTLCGMCP